jgi:hypothetical protein
MPFQLIHYKKGHDNMEFPHFMLKNIHTGEMVKKSFKSKEGAIGFAKNAIRFREKVDSKVVGKGNNVKILPIKKSMAKKPKIKKSGY